MRKRWWCLFSIFILFHPIYGKTKEGKLIVAMGLPGSGKTSVMHELSIMCHAKCFYEPEEEEWAPAVSLRELSGYFTMISWFRSIRVPQLYQADQLKKKNQLVFVDSYYDKLLHGYLGASSLEWLIRKDDPYYAVLKNIAQIDWEILPNADCIVFLEVEYSEWISFLKNRNRNFDEGTYLKNFFLMQKKMIEAAEKLSAEKSIEFIRFKQKKSSPKESAVQLKEILQMRNVIKVLDETRDVNK